MTPLPLARRLLEDQRVRFLLVGGFNTAFGFLLFVLFEVTLGRVLGYFVSLYSAFVISVIVAFVMHRRITYRVTGTGNVLLDLARFTSVYLVSLAINTVALPLLVEVAGIPAIPAQGLIVTVTTLVSYFGHKFFSFRRADEEPSALGDPPAQPQPDPKHEA